MSKYLIFHLFSDSIPAKDVQTTNMGQVPRQKAASPGFRWSHGNCSPQPQSPFHFVSPGVVWVVRAPAELLFRLSLVWSTLPSPVS